MIRFHQSWAHTLVVSLPCILLLIPMASTSLTCYKCDPCVKGQSMEQETCQARYKQCLAVTVYKGLEETDDQIEKTWRSCGAFPLGCHNADSGGNFALVRCACEGNLCNGASSRLSQLQSPTRFWQLLVVIGVGAGIYTH